jgi:pimeloyl-ACP methyl ester carboxylesterase
MAAKIEVWENRRTKAGRKISLSVIVIPAKAPSPNKSPLFVLSGGPGVSATSGVDSWLKDVELPSCLFQDRDVVLVDQRGCGGSNALTVTASPVPEAPLQRILSTMDQSADDIRAFRVTLAKQADLTQYGTSRFVEDLDEVREKLGYEKIDLWGTSYGTRPAQEYIRRYPDRVRSVVFLGPMPLGTKYLVERPLYSQQALARLLEDCLTNDACRRAFPEISKELDETVDRLAKEPARFRFKHRSRALDEELQMTRDAFAEALRLLQSSHQGMSFIPYVIHEAHQGNFTPLARLALPPKLDQVHATWGLRLCLAFSDDIPFFPFAVWEQLAPRTFMVNGMAKLSQQCQGIWTSGEAPSDFLEPVISDVPALIITGRFDSLTPVEGGDELARRFKNGRHVVVPRMTHVPFDLPNEQADFLSVLDEFYDLGSVVGLDASPMERLAGPAYVTTDAEFELKMLLGGR